MKLTHVSDQAAWNAFQAAQPYSQFLQSWDWGEFRIADGSPVRRYVLMDERSHWLATIQMEYRSRRFGLGYWFAPRGPVFASSLDEQGRREVMMTLCEELLRIPELRSRALFWRMEPASRLSQPEGLMPLSFRRAHSMNPASTLLLHLELSKEELLKAMHEKTRYNIRVAERRGVVARVATTAQDLEIFLDLMEETATRDEIRQHPRSYLRKTYEFLQACGMARIRLAELEGKALAASLEMCFGDTVIYLYGASSSDQRQMMAPYVLHWQAIQEAKSQGYRYYDFGGTNPQSKAMYYYKSSWEGITRFKLGWGGERINLMGTWDLPFNQFLYRCIFWRQFFRG